MRRKKHNKRNVNKYYLLGLQNKRLSRAGRVTGEVEIRSTNEDKISLESPEENKTHGTHV